MRSTRRRSNRRPPKPEPAAADFIATTSTPASVRLTYVDSVTGERIFAGIIDLALTLALGFVLSIGFSVTERGEGGTKLSLGLNGWHFWLYIAMVLAYGLVCEGLWGKTLGKKIAGIRVVSSDNERLSWPRAAVRNLLRPVDAIPGFYAVGLVIMLATKRKQRIGDLVAKTIVVRD